MDVAVPILGSMPCDKAAYHKGLKTLEQKLGVLDAHLRSRTFLVSTCRNGYQAVVMRSATLRQGCWMQMVALTACWPMPKAAVIWL